MRKLVSAYPFIIMLVFVLLFGPEQAQAQASYSVKLAQVDTSRYPEITLSVNVDDSSGTPVSGLKREDFGVTEDGTSVEITNFAGTSDVRTVDVVFAFDTTGSMTNEIEGVKQTAIAFAQKLKDKKRDYRLGLVTFGDEIRGVYNKDGSLTDNAQEFQSWIASLSANGGGDDPELSLGAVKQATKMTYRPQAQKVIILITDAPAHHTGDGGGPGDFSDPDLNADRVAELLKQKGITLYAVAYDSPDYHKLTDETHGEFYNLTPGADFTGIIDKIGTNLANQYRMTYRSPRPTYDGTHRNIVVSVGGTGSSPSSSSSGSYTEQHLINLRSDPLVALIFSFPLLFALAAPALWRGVRHVRATRQTGANNYVPMLVYCPYCHAQQLRPDAKFCRSCGRSLLNPSGNWQPPSSVPIGGWQSPPPVLGGMLKSASGPTPPQPDGVVTCKCGSVLQARSRFCPWCGAPR
ncbi:MAG: VWA domain-containing protein [Anaerolineae bacterium]